jgi:hypothetical protein
MKPVPEVLECPLPESSASTGSDADDDEGDRTTLKDVSQSVAPPEIEDNASSELKADVITKGGNGNIIGGFENEREASPQEKQPNLVHLALPPAITPPPVVNAAG